MGSLSFSTQPVNSREVSLSGLAGMLKIKILAWVYVGIFVI